MVGERDRAERPPAGSEATDLCPGVRGRVVLDGARVPDGVGPAVAAADDEHPPAGQRDRAMQLPPRGHRRNRRPGTGGLVVQLGGRPAERVERAVAAAAGWPAPGDQHRRRRYTGHRPVSAARGGQVPGGRPRVGRRVVQLAEREVRGGVAAGRHAAADDEHVAVAQQHRGMAGAGVGHRGRRRPLPGRRVPSLGRGQRRHRLPDRTAMPPVTSTEPRRQGHGAVVPAGHLEIARARPRARGRVVHLGGGQRRRRELAACARAAGDEDPAVGEHRDRVQPARGVQGPGRRPVACRRVVAGRAGERGRGRVPAPGDQHRAVVEERGTVVLAGETALVGQVGGRRPGAGGGRGRGRASGTPSAAQGVKISVPAANTGLAGPARPVLRCGRRR